MSEFGRTWWGKRWLRTLEQLGLSYPNSRMGKARTLVRKDAVDLMDVSPGELSAWVDEPPRSFGVSLRLPQWDEETWQRCCAVLARRLGNLVTLLDDQLPTNVDKQLEAAGISLFPTDDELDTYCPCRDRSAVCVHVIAMQHAFARLFDDDPFALCVLRGGDRESLIAGIRAARTPRAAPADPGGVRPTDAGGFYQAAGDIEKIVKGV